MVSLRHVTFFPETCPKGPEGIPLGQTAKKKNHKLRFAILTLSGTFIDDIE
jgi:hypothetical protein